MKTRSAAVALAAGALVVFAEAPASAHTPSESYLRLEATQGSIRGRLDIAVADLDVAIVLDEDGDGQITFGELTRAAPRADAELKRGVELYREGQSCPLTVGPPRVVDHSGLGYAAFALSFACPGTAGTPLELRYDLLFDTDAQHRALVSVGTGGDEALPFAITAAKRVVSVSLDDRSSVKRFVDMVGEGARHIASGYDHLLFLLALILPSVRRRDAAGIALPSFRSVLLRVAKTVSLFTVAHSVTLALAALGVVHPPTRFIEAGIAASVAAAALNNVVPLFGSETGVFAFAMGLLHGFGFAGGLGHLGTHGTALVVSLFGFNLGVELGQLAFLGAVLPLMFAASRQKAYGLLLRGGSLAIVSVALVWFAQRLFSISV